MFALVGPNGAGKTTTVEILEGHRRRDGGVVSVLGFDPATAGRDYRERIGIVLQEAGVDEDFSVAELLRLYRAMYPRRLDLDQVIGLVGLSDKRNARVRTLSGGQRRRLDLALGLVGDPDLLFLDEPTTGFDPSARRQAWILWTVCATWARQCCSRRTTWTRHSTWLTGWASSLRAGCRPSAPTWTAPTCLSQEQSC